MRYTEDQRKEYVLAWKATKLSRKQFSESQSICYASFLKWTKEYGTEFQESFIRLEDRSSFGNKIVLPNGVTIQTDQTISGALLKMLLDV